VRGLVGHARKGFAAHWKSAHGRIFIENPPPFKQVPREEGRARVAVPIEKGVETAEHYLDLPVRLAGLHHSDLDRYEVMRRGGITPSERYDSFDYLHVLKQNLHGFPVSSCPIAWWPMRHPRPRSPASAGLWRPGSPASCWWAGDGAEGANVLESGAPSWEEQRASCGLVKGVGSYSRPGALR
jgi:hypothetical protein